MKATFYKSPHGMKETIKINNIFEEDEKFFTENGIIISLEELGGDFVVYADTGTEDEEGEPVEFLEIAQGRSCNDVLKSLRVSCEDHFNKQETE